ncbi:hypothetical protein IAD21_05549 [Abditibacteriota bacterium]|nr:hypothetical protein IAD21_05549 [Abditibacteriota bacterium]
MRWGNTMLRIKAFGLDIYGCQEALERLDDYVDHELSPEETQKVRQHLKLCHHCARKFSFEEELIAGMKSKAQRIQLPADVDAFKAKINALLKQEAAPESDQSAASTN